MDIYTDHSVISGRIVSIWPDDVGEDFSIICLGGAAPSSYVPVCKITALYINVDLASEYNYYPPPDEIVGCEAKCEEGVRNLMNTLAGQGFQTGYIFDAGRFSETNIWPVVSHYGVTLLTDAVKKIAQANYLIVNCKFETVQQPTTA